ncbi:hypothetical protein LINGRAHAP2_LOCUS7641 [Linum grandiflorum]
MQFENMMIPCSHMLFVLKEEYEQELPNSFLKFRWSKNPKSLERIQEKNDMDETQLIAFRYGLLQYSVIRYFDLGSHTHQSFKHAKLSMTTLCEELEKLDASPPNIQKAKVADEYKNVKNPDKARHKGCGDVRGKKVGEKRKRCSNCREIGHMKPNCKATVAPKNDAEKGESSNASQKVRILIF